ncbi:MAG: sodium ion-translocating decarboxylase subunit beta, partial [Candidatus Contendobacter sp.]|nr:sodium ion-translocating decarboxylase subunit beta [Candidatus Contendobacter sp.]
YPIAVAMGLTPGAAASVAIIGGADGPMVLFTSLTLAKELFVPLGGVVQTVHVNVGQVINEGDKLVSLEAMKMVTHVIARRGGKVISIAVKAGDPVDAGQVLLTIG